jgi:hypothetical protein
VRGGQGGGGGQQGEDGGSRGRTEAAGGGLRQQEEGQGGPPPPPPQQQQQQRRQWQQEQRWQRLLTTWCSANCTGASGCTASRHHLPSWHTWCWLGGVCGLQHRGSSLLLHVPGLTISLCAWCVAPPAVAGPPADMWMHLLNPCLPAVALPCFLSFPIAEAGPGGGGGRHRGAPTPATAEAHGSQRPHGARCCRSYGHPPLNGSCPQWLGVQDAAWRVGVEAGCL